MFFKKKTKNLFIILTSIVSLNYGNKARAQESSKNVRIGLALVYSHNRVHQGALIWDAPIMAAGPSFVLFDTVSIGQGGLSLFKKLDEFQTIAIGASYFDDNAPNAPVIKLKNKREDFKNKRQSTYGTYLKYDFRFRQYLSISATYHQDLKRHKGSYLNGRVSTSIIPFITIGTGIGITDEKNSKFVYGPSAVSGVGHRDNFGTLMLPFLPWRGRLMINYTHTKITQDKNINADYIRGNDSNSSISVIAAWNF